MKLLLDTHTFMWWDAAPTRLSPKALAICSSREHELVLSVVSLWEMQIKAALGKLHLKAPLRQLVEAQQDLNGLSLLNVHSRHVYALEDLPLVHRDPFDRMLIAQAQVDSMHIVTVDRVFLDYPVAIIW